MPSAHTPQFVNNFWGSSPEQSFDIINTRIKDSLNTLSEIVKFYSERISIENEYSRRLEKLQHKCPLGSHETGRTKIGLEKLELENQTMIDNIQKFIKTTTRSNLEKLQTFQQLYAKRVAKLQHHMGKVIIKRQQALKELEHYKGKYKEECNQIKSLRLLMQTTWGKELDKHQVKFNKVSAQINGTRQNYQIALVNYKEINDIYKKDWSISLNDFYKLEIERMQTIKINCFNYCNNIATLCVDQDQAVDSVRPLFAQIQPPQDIEEFSRNYGTGNKVYEDPEFVDYLEGKDDPKIGYTVVNMATPDYAGILTREYSTYQAKPDLPPSQLTRKPPSDYQSNYSDDVFSRDERLESSNGSSGYSWPSPKKKEQELHELQERISRKATNDFKVRVPKRPEAKKVPIMKDFSIDFIAKALEDLNSGGNGDVNQFRRSLRNGRPKSDFVDDHDEVAQRYNSILFNVPPPPEEKTKYVGKARAKYTFKPQQKEELYFKKGWEMYVIKKQEDNWFVCELAENCGDHAGEVGLVPGNYVIDV